MQKVKLLATLVALCTTIHAWSDVTPVAVWSDFNTTAVEGGSVDLHLASDSDASGNALGDDGSVTINKRPVSVTVATPFNCDSGYTVLIKYSGLVSTTANQAIVAACTNKDNNQTNVAYDEDTIGLYVKDASGTLAGIWQHDKWATTDGGAGSIPTAGVIGLCYSSTAPQTQGIGMAEDASSATVYFGKTGLAAGGRTVTGFSIGATKAMTTAATTEKGLIPATGMKISGIAVFSSKLTADQVAAYEFPEPEPEPDPETPTVLPNTLDFSQFVTKTYQDTGWKIKLSDLSRYTITGTMSGPSMSPKNDPSTACFFENQKEGTDDVISFQMQVRQTKAANDDWLKAVLVYLKYDQTTQSIHIKAVSAGYVSGVAPGTTKITNWNSNVAESANSGAYGVATVHAVKNSKDLPTADVTTLTEEATAAYVGNTVTATLTNLDLREYAADELKAVLQITETTDFGAKKAAFLALADGGIDSGIAGTFDGSDTFTFNVTGLHANSIAHATITVYVVDEEGVDHTIATAELSLHQGKLEYVVNGDWINESNGTFGSTGVWGEGVTTNTVLVVNNAAGVTFKPVKPTEYVEKCDSEFTVELYATEAVDKAADSDTDLTNVQGGLRLVKGSSKSEVVLEYLDAGAWQTATNVTRGLDAKCTVKAVFHYQGIEGETPDCVTYYVLNDDRTQTNKVIKTTGCAAVEKRIISEVYVSDGTKLGYLIGSCQTEAVVVVDVVVKEIVPGDEIEVDSESAAQALTVKVSDAVSAVIGINTAAVEAYKGYFKVVATPTTEGGVTKYKATLEFTDKVKTDLEKEVEKALQTVVESFNSDEPQKIKGKPGLYYAIKRGDEINKMAVEEEEIAGPDGTVNIEIKKQEGSDKHFYRVVVSPTPVKPTAN